jgi:sugar phosphate isomerase/epimerase
MTTDYVTNRGNPEPYLRRIADAGFTHVHWCHEWNTDGLYTVGEVERIARRLDEYGLKVLDLHGSHGNKKRWYSWDEKERIAGLELVKNRIAMTARLGSRTVVIHAVGEADARGAQGRERFLTPLCKSLDTLEPYAQAHNVRLALENMPQDDFGIIRELLAKYPDTFLGLCYDSGHGNIGGQGLEHLASVRERLAAVHLHDNKGSTDSHDLPFAGTVDWERLAGIMAASAYWGCVSLESNMRGDSIDESSYLAQAFDAAKRFSTMVADYRANQSHEVHTREAL